MIHMFTSWEHCLQNLLNSMHMRYETLYCACNFIKSHGSSIWIKCDAIRQLFNALYMFLDACFIPAVCFL